MPGQTTTVRYFSLTQVDIPYSECLTLAGCPGVQVAFGDPRNEGGVNGMSFAGRADFEANSE